LRARVRRFGISYTGEELPHLLWHSWPTNVWWSSYMKRTAPNRKEATHDRIVEAAARAVNDPRLSDAVCEAVLKHLTPTDYWIFTDHRTRVFVSHYITIIIPTHHQEALPSSQTSAAEFECNETPQARVDSTK
jgi:hypothetical protein